LPPDPWCPGRKQIGLYFASQLLDIISVCVWADKDFDESSIAIVQRAEGATTLRTPVPDFVRLGMMAMSVEGADQLLKLGLIDLVASQNAENIISFSHTAESHNFG
jgi:hypothetical protein